MKRRGLLTGFGFLCTCSAFAQWPKSPSAPASRPDVEAAPPAWPSDNPSDRQVQGGQPSTKESKAGRGRTLALDGCQLKASAGEATRRFVSTTGNEELDRLIFSEAGVIAGMFQVAPGFSFYDDRTEGGNAFATSTSLLGRPNGTVALGVRLVFEQWQASGPTSVGGIMAHEWAHILQYANGIMSATILKELQADFMAGWYVSNRQRNGVAANIQHLASTLFSMGDYQFNSPSTHGTPPQRVNSMSKGYQAGIQGANLQQAFALSTT